eukprot:jgi/Galph1/170/GphlegSOOS_G4920.1
MNSHIRVSVKMPKYMQESPGGMVREQDNSSPLEKGSSGLQDSSSRENSSITGSRQDEVAMDDTPRYKHNHRLGIACPACSASKHGRLPSDFFQRAAAKEEESLNRLFSILRNILDDPESELFKGPSQERQVQKRPIDLTTLRENLHHGKYRLRHDMFIKDLRQLFKLTLVYYDPESRLGRAARKFLRVIEEGLEPESSRSESELLLHAGDRVDVLGSDNNWHSATVVQVQGSKYYIHFDGSSMGVDEQIDIRSNRVVPFDTYARQKVPYREPLDRVATSQKNSMENTDRGSAAVSSTWYDNQMYSLKRQKQMPLSSLLLNRSLGRGRPSAVFFALQLKSPVIPSVADIRKSLLFEDPSNRESTIEVKSEFDLVDDCLVIEKIISRRFNIETRTVEYLVKWKDYGMDDCSWESREALLAVAPRFIAEFDVAHPEIPFVAQKPSQMETRKEDNVAFTTRSNHNQTEEEQLAVIPVGDLSLEIGRSSWNLRRKTDNSVAKAQSFSSVGGIGRNSVSQGHISTAISNDPLYIIPHGFGTVAKH